MNAHETPPRSAEDAMRRVARVMLEEAGLIDDDPEAAAALESAAQVALDYLADPLPGERG